MISYAVIDPGLGPAHDQRALPDRLVARAVRDLVDVEDERDEQRDRQRDVERLPAPLLRAHEVRTERHHRAEPERGDRLAETAVHEPERRSGVREAQRDADRADREEPPAPLGGEEQPDARSRPRRTPTHARTIAARLTSPYWITRDPPLNGVGVTFAASAPLASSKMSLAMLRPRCTAHAGDEREQPPAPARTRRRAAATAPPSATGHDRRGEERQPGREEERPPPREVRAGRRRRSRYSCATGTLRSAYSKNGTSASSQPVARSAVT